MFSRCPASIANTPNLKIKKCPDCGEEVEVFSNDVRVKCDKCGSRSITTLNRAYSGVNMQSSVSVRNYTTG